MSATPLFPVTIQDVKVTCLVTMTLAIAATTFRLLERLRTRKFGIDDWFALLSMTMTIVFMACLFVHLGDPTHLTQTTRVAMYYILAQFFYGIIWTARLSILFSVIRICPSGTPYRRMLLGLAGVFGVIFFILFAQVFWVCETEPLWKDTPAPQCTLGHNVAIAQLITDIFADGCLIAAPLRLIWNIKTSKAQKYRLIAVFSTSIATTAVSLTHAFFVFKIGGLDEVLIAIVENGVSLIVCNLAVLVSVFIRISRLRSAGQTQSDSYGMNSRGVKSYTAGATSQTVDFATIIREDEFSVSRKAPLKVYEDDSSFDQPKSSKWDWPQGPQVHVAREQIVS